MFRLEPLPESTKGFELRLGPRSSPEVILLISYRDVVAVKLVKQGISFREDERKSPTTNKHQDQFAADKEHIVAADRLPEICREIIHEWSKP